MKSMKMMMLPLLITLLHSPVCLSVTVSSSKPKVEVHEHTDAVLSCEFRTEKDQSPRIEWKKKGKAVTFVYFNHKFIGSYAGRAKIEGATLTIHSVTQKDSGEYRCEVTASEDHVNLGEATVTLNVLVPPHVPSCEVPSSVFVGSGLELHCKDKLSVPPATYRCTKSFNPPPPPPPPIRNSRAYKAPQYIPSVCETPNSDAFERRERERERGKKKVRDVPEC
ncbi:Junctional adhesion molecule B [Larimichthys crocea]|uniref:Uncharacterized protein n=1 Tax=Larimichthys crocea TaxID=215358 RepID=A0ACD3QGG0_LARCR|nr:Junctional adhesion molecule B [Larimichthys crocea]